jgi:hypothetical protein
MEMGTLPNLRPSAPPQPQPVFGGFLFRRGASRREKAFTLFALFWMALSLYGITSSFVANSWWNWQAAYLALPISLFFFIPIALDRHPANRVPTFGRLKRGVYYLGQFTVCYVFAWMGLGLGSASVATLIGGQEISGDYRVVWKSDGRWKRRECKHSLRIVRLDSEWNTKTCVDEAFWATTAVGDALRASGRASTFGIMILELEKNVVVERGSGPLSVH